MKKLTSQPSGKYYTRIVNGGLNGAVLGMPTVKGANVLCNCVGFANGRFNQVINDPELKGINKAFQYQLTCNAENFIESAKRQGLKISSTPTLGGIMVWQKGATLGGGDGAGHVAVVEEIYDDGTILTSESGWNAWAFKTVRRSNYNGRWSQASAYKFRGCIINPSIKTKTVPAPKLTVDGIGGEATVRAMQKFFGTPQDGVISGQNKSLAKYYPALKAVNYGANGSTCIKRLQKWLGVTQDGVLGEKTVKAWQKKLGVSSDGVFGANSMRAWQEYLNKNDKAVYPKETKSQKITSTAKSYCGSKTKETTAYKNAARSVYGKGNDTYCHRYVGTVLYKCGYPKMDYSGKTATAWKKIMAYLRKNFDEVKSPQAGDIHVTRSKKGAYHIFIELGNGKKAEANSKKKYYPHIADTNKGAQNWIFRAR